MKTLTISGVDFTFRRMVNARNGGKHWQVSVTKTGTVLDCFPGKTLKAKVQGINDVARVCGSDRFKRDTESA